jgi:copper(I)-binding protein
MTLANNGDADDRLTSVRTDIADTVELHETSTEGGSMSMQQVDGIDIPSGGDAVLEPGGLHVMLVGVTQELTEGDTVDLTLTFEAADDQTVSAEVVPVGDLPQMDMGSEGMDMESEG